MDTTKTKKVMNDCKDGTSSSKRSVGVIEALDPLVVDRIAAGEVVQRPSSVMKELLENCLDADSTCIDVCVGWDNRTLVVKDNGCGISKSSLPLAATRFATSKLKQWDDLKQIGTFGFRGEALASASMVGKLSITSRTIHQKCAFACNYQDGTPIRLPPCALAGTIGTTIQLSDLFYNVPARLRAIQNNTQEEYHRILSIVQKYAIAQAHLGVGMVCRRRSKPKARSTNNNNSTTDLNTTSILHHHHKTLTNQNSNNKLEITKQVIRHIFGTHIANPLQYFEFQQGNVHTSTLQAIQHLQQQQSSELSKSVTTTTTNKYCSKDDDFTIPNTNNNSTKSNNTINNNNSQEENNHDKEEDMISQSSFAYEAYGLITMEDTNNNSSSNSPTKNNGKKKKKQGAPIFILFINGRLVESSFIKKSIDTAYHNSQMNNNNNNNNNNSGSTKPPFCFLSLTLPGPHVDVNVHPTKRQVALLHQDSLCQSLETNIQQQLLLLLHSSNNNNHPNSQTFSTQTDLIHTNTKQRNHNKTNNKNHQHNPITPPNPTTIDLIKQQQQQHNKQNNNNNNNNDDSEEEDFVISKKRKSSSSPNNHHDKKSVNNNNNSSPPKKQRQFVSPLSSVIKSPYDPKNLVRIRPAAPSGAIEPYLVSTQPSQQQPQQQNNNQQETPTTTTTTTTRQQLQLQQHDPDCELYDSYGKQNNNNNIDMTQPGAFAQLICRCQLKQPPLLLSQTQPQSNNKPLFLRGGGGGGPRRSRPTPIMVDCDLTSIINLRQVVQSNRASEETLRKLRHSIYVGTLSQHRSLIQWEMELLMIHHTKLANELFYQLGLFQFSKIPMASMGQQPIHVYQLLEYELQSMSLLQPPPSSSNNNNNNNVYYSSQQIQTFAKEATLCLESHKDMLKEYFSIHLDTTTNTTLPSSPPSTTKEEQQPQPILLLKGLPILLEGHSPSPHGLSTFLWKLAMDVNWMEEEECFHGILTQLANYYAQIPSSSNDDGDDTINQTVSDSTKKYIQHELFPAISYLLLPSSDTLTNGSMSKMAVLSKLYKVFERC